MFESAVTKLKQSLAIFQLHLHLKFKCEQKSILSLQLFKILKVVFFNPSQFLKLTFANLQVRLDSVFGRHPLKHLAFQLNGSVPSFSLIKLMK